MDKQEEQELVERIRARCVEVGDCLEWALGVNTWGQAFIKYQGARYAVRRVMYQAKNGAVPQGKIVSDTCGNPRCVKHLTCITLAQRNHKVAAAGWYKSPLRRAKQAAKARERSFLSDDSVAAIRASTGSAMEVAREFGISKTYVYMLRRGEWRKPICTPFAGLMR